VGGGGMWLLRVELEDVGCFSSCSTKHNYLTSPNRELVALGAANLLGSFFGAFPTFASLARSAVGDMVNYL
jgi:MFS superfamily sulfate permease-like transporter